MTKRTRFFIFAVSVAFILYFLTPSIRWYFMFSENDKYEAGLLGDTLKSEIGKRVSEATSALSKGEETDKFVGELEAIRKSFLKEVKKINKANVGEDPIDMRKDYSYADMYDILLKKRKKEKFVDSFFKNILEDYYSARFSKKRAVKNGIIKLGLDLQGGAYAVISVNFDHPSMKGKKFTAQEKSEMIDSAVIKIENRINRFGVSETSIQKMKEQDKILINLPGVKETSELRSIIETVGILEFKVVSKEGSEILSKIYQEAGAKGESIVDEESQLLEVYQKMLPANTEALYVSNKDEWGVEKENKQMLVVEKESLLGENVKIQSASVQTGNLGQYVINFVLDGEDAKRWAEVTGANVGRQIAIILDDIILETPVVQEKITGGRSQITLGNAPIEHLQNIALILKSGSMNVPLEISEENSVGASLGQDTISKALWACLWGVIAVFLFMFLYYNIGGIIADIAVVLNIFFLLGGLALFGGTLTLPGIAGIVLTVGMAVDANIIIFERIKEEFRSGKTLKTAISLGYDRAFWTIMDSNLTTFAAGIGLTLFGTGAIKGFAVTLCLGIVSSLYTALFVSKLEIDWLMSVKEFKSLRILSLLRGGNKKYEN
ncbi:MAG TPA: protein translocase subunit SecD [Spirochaetota bacterium]|nr:MAG: preprotein translocase subunit SecD [Spirochaetes bacterium ADurb.Bin133]HOF01238.1 protein translocase subunit SecD [Spirochaetota bacterium]HOS32730.1 protein translocase subunit SecD [Spirochaetota bacterium]HOS54614.1 protein translocase subunit SecD [Spirochaetota bacterium]HPY86799.1 protein translocase subunit SecD [Spirochaetota bacterium]